MVSCRALLRRTHKCWRTDSDFTFAYAQFCLECSEGVQCWTKACMYDLK